MKIQRIFFLALLVQSGFTDVAIKNRSFTQYHLKRLDSVTKIMTSSTVVECAFSCMETDGCYAVNFRKQTSGNCELTTGLSDDQDMLNDVSSDLFIMEYNRCAEEPEFCENGATCERTWSSARCHCPDGIQFGETCHISFTVIPQKDCNQGNDLHDLPPDDTTDHEACKIWCANNAICGGFVVGYGRCWFKDVMCFSDMHDVVSRQSEIYLKVTN